MADNTLLNSGTGGDTIATDDIAGVKHQRIKVGYGVDGSFTDASATNPMPVVDASATPAGTNIIGKVGIDQTTDGTTNKVQAFPQAITKGTQGTVGVTTQDLKDAGRVLKTYATVGDTGITGVVAATLVTMTPYADLVAGTAATTFAVTSGKRLRLQQLNVTWRNNTAAAGGVTIRLRMLAGSVLVGSPIHMTLNANSAASAAIGGGGSNSYQFPDGFELSGTMQFGITQQAIGAVAGFSVEVIGYEY